MSELGSASGRIEIDVGGALSAIDKVHNGVQSLGDAGGNVGSRFNVLKNGVLGLGTALLAPMTMGLRGAVSLEQGIADVNASLGGLDASTLDALSDMFIEVGSASRYSATEVAAVSDELAKAGFDADTLLGGMTASVVELAQATGDGLGPATDGMIQAFAMWAPEIVGTENAITDAARAADILTIAANQSAGGIGDVIGGLRNAGPALASVGMGFDEAAAAIAMFTNYGYSGDEIGTKLSRTLTFLSKPTDDAAAAMEQYGIKAFDAQGKFIGFPALFDQLQTGFAGVGDEARLAALKTIFGAEAFDLMNIAIETGGDPLREFTGEMEATGVAAEQSALRMDTLGAQFEELMESTQGFLTSLVNGLIPGLRALVDGANALVNALMKIPQPIKTVIGAVAGLMAGIAGANAAMRSSQAITALLGINMGGLGAAMLSLMPIFALIAAAAGALYLAWRSNFLGIRDAIQTFRDVWENLTDSVVNNPLSRALSATSAALRSFDVGWLDTLADKLTGLSMAFHSFMGAFGRVGGTQRVDIEVGGDDKILEKIANPDASDGFDYFVRLQNPDGSLDEFGQIIESYTDESDPNIAHIKVQTDDGAFWTTIDNTTGEIGTGTIEIEADTKDARRNLDRLNDGLDAMEKTLRKRGLDTFADGLRGVRRFAGDVARVIRDLRYNFDQFRNAGVGPVTSALYALGAVFPSLRSYIEPVTQAISRFTGAFADARDRGLNPVQAALEGVSAVFPPLEEAIDRVQSVVTSFTDAWGHLTDAVGLFFEGEWSEGFDALREAAQDAWDGIREGLDLAGDLAVAFADWVLDVGVPTVTGWVVDAAGDVWGAISTAAGWAWSQIAPLGWWALNTAAPEIWGWLRDVGWPAIRSAATWTWNQVGELGAWFLDTMPPRITGWLSNVAWPAIRQAANWTWNNVGELGAWTLEVGEPAIRFLVDIAQAVKSALPRVVAEIGDFLWNLALGNPSVILGFDIDRAIEDAIGKTVYHVVDVVLSATKAFLEDPEAFLGVVAKAVSAVLVGLAAIQVAIALAPFLAPIALAVGLALLGYMAYRAVVDYFVRNPLEAVELALKFKGVLEAFDLPSPVRTDDGVKTFLFGAEGTLLRDLIDGKHTFNIDLNIDVNWPDIPAPPEPQWFRNMRDGRLPWDNGDADLSPRESNYAGLGATPEPIDGSAVTSGGVPVVSLPNVGTGPGGPFAAITSSISSLISKLSELPPAIDTATGSVTTFVANTIGVMGGWTTGLQTMLTTVSTALTTQTSTATITAQASITTFVASTIGVMGGWITGIQTIVNSAMDVLRTRVSGATAGAKGSVTTFVADTIGVMGGWSGGFRTIVNSAMDTLRTRVSGATAGAKGSVTTFVADTIGVMGGWSGGFRTIVNGAMNEAVSAIQRGMQTATTAISTQSAAWSTIISAREWAMRAAGTAVGQAAGAGVAQGLLNALGAVTAAANAIVAQVDRALNAAAEVGSPARRFFPHGSWITKGVASGQTSPDALRALRAAADTVITTLDRAFADATPPSLEAASFIGAGQYGASGIPTYALASAQAPPIVTNYHHTEFIALSASDLQRLTEQAERGGNFARTMQRPGAAQQYLRGKR